MDAKEKMRIPKQTMKEQEPSVRVKNFHEVPLGFTVENAKMEANRCLQCKKPGCVPCCPVNIQIPDFIKLITEDKFVEASKLIKENNLFPSICGRVCPQEDQCEKGCVLKKQGVIGIGKLEKFVGDYERKNAQVVPPAIKPPTGKKVAIVGSGPSGLACAADLAREGHDVTVFEAFHKPGGVLLYGIPEFRLPKEIVTSEISLLEKMGVKIQCNVVIGKLDSIDDLFANGFHSVFIGTGAGLPTFMGIEGESLNGVYSANEYLTRSNLMKAYRFPEYDTPIHSGRRVAVVGGGNVAMDSVRTALRLGAEVAYIIYRRTISEITARQEEIHHTQQEGAEFMLLTSPKRYIGNNQGWGEGVECQKMELGTPDSSGRRRPVPIPNSEFILPIDCAVVAIGNGANPLVQATTPGLKTRKGGYIEVTPETLETTRKGVFAGGDIVTGAATVIHAMSAGRLAAKKMHIRLTSGS